MRKQKLKGSAWNARWLIKKGAKQEIKKEDIESFIDYRSPLR
jgi:hypothetical protein